MLDKLFKNKSRNAVIDPHIDDIPKDIDKSEAGSLIVDILSELSPNSNLVPMPDLFCRDYLVKRDNLFPGKSEISDFFIDQVLKCKPFNLMLLHSGHNYYQSDTWFEFYKEGVLKDINAHLRETEGGFLHLPMINSGFIHHSGLIMRFNETVVRMLRDRIVTALKKVGCLDDEYQEGSLENYQKFMLDIPNISFDLSDIPFELYSIKSNYYGISMNCISQTAFYDIFSTFKLELVNSIHDGVFAINTPEQDQKWYSLITMKGKNGFYSHIFFDIHAFLKQYRNMETIAQ